MLDRYGDKRSGLRNELGPGDEREHGKHHLGLSDFRNALVTSAVLVARGHALSLLVKVGRGERVKVRHSVVESHFPTFSPALSGGRLLNKSIITST